MKPHGTETLLYTIDNTGVVCKHNSNEEVFQTILMSIAVPTDSDPATIYKIHCKVESYEGQSHCDLLRFSASGDWTLIKTVNPQRDYNITNIVGHRSKTRYAINSDENVFRSIIEHFKQLARDFEAVLRTETSTHTRGG